MESTKYLKNKRVLVVGLGLLGGGVATTRWLLKHGAQVTVTDLRSRTELASSIKALGRAGEQVRFVLGRHDEKDLARHDLVVVNPAVPLLSPFIVAARKKGLPIENELTLFLRFCKNPIIGVTGTRGKTTTATWAHHFIKSKFPKAVLSGNTAQDALLKVLDRLDKKSPVVLELSSFQLELRQPEKIRVAIITNLMRDHLNRHGTMAAYAKAKANLFCYQQKGDILILPRKNKWTNFFSKQNLRSRIIFYDTVQFGFKIPAWFEAEKGAHNLLNLRAAAHAAHTMGITWAEIKRGIKNLPAPRFRQEVIFKKGGLTIINDATATTPDATIVAIERFFNPRKPIILIAGGTDKRLDFGQCARIIEKRIAPERLFLLEGSATRKMLGALARSFAKHVRVFGALSRCLQAALKEARKSKQATVLFSPGGTSFEKFKNEFDRGEKFNQAVKTLTHQPRR